MYLHNVLYRYISELSVIANNGIHPKHRIMNYHSFFVDNINSSDTVLDIGCGNGFLAFDVAKKAKNVTAIDLSDNNIKFAKKHFYSITSICRRDQLPLAFRKFDAVILSNVSNIYSPKSVIFKRRLSLALTFISHTGTDVKS
jgi:2-polyprenyl-3-methyl-5-hydroxy-6-metoxy-1,4-benzoquinol methylase